MSPILTKQGDRTAIWRGTDGDDEPTGSKLVLKLPDDAKKLVSRYPRRTK